MLTSSPEYKSIRTGPIWDREGALPSSIQVMVDMRPALKTVLAIGRVGYRAAAADETSTSSERTEDASILMG